MAGTVVDGVQRLPLNGITVIIIGAGNAGLQAALECWRKGCEVVVLERSEKLSRIGDFYTINPSALTTLKDYPNMFKDYHRRVYNCSVHIFTPAGEEIARRFPEWKQPGAVHGAPDVDISFLKRRPEFAQMQLDQMIRLGISVHWGEEVVEVSETDDLVAVTTTSGARFIGDVCVGAMGLNTNIKGMDTGPGMAVQDSGYAVARIAFPRSTIKDGSPASTLLKDVDIQPQFRTYLGRDIHIILFLTADYVAFVYTHADHDLAEESWSPKKKAEDLIPYLEKAGDDWDPAVLDFVRSAPEGVIDWKLRWRDSARQWTSDRGRLIRVGDSAHAFFPTAGNGANSALEDAISLAECLRIGGKEGVTQATKVHNKLRFERTSILQQTGLVNREELHNADFDEIRSAPDKNLIGFFKSGRWIWAHDAELYARDNYHKCLAHLVDGAPFSNTNIPPGHVYEPWTLESETKRMEAGIKSNLKQNGDWSV